ncbi:thiol reductant ABC exporter subunit CydC [Frankia sp. CiP3]|uniref:thiol reductant ABC exporter subunit CydC n=1 Tax=Frankia sp. CiP3 TaxID=2880971 RepID=UPI001EF68EC2|nr:thiol reductant ABC exporter subunit CydC [Frankia sp. CiP3]
MTTTRAAEASAGTAQPVPLRRLIPLFGPYHRLFVATVAAGLASHGLGVAAAALAAWLVGAAASGHTASSLTPSILALACCVAGHGLARWAEMWVAHDYSYRIIADLRVRLYDALERTAPAQLLEQRSGDLAATVIGDVETLEWFYAHTIAAYVVAVAVPATTLGVLATIAPVLALLLLGPLLALASVPFWLAARAVRQGARLRTHLGALHADVIDGVHGLRELVSLGRGNDHLTRLRTATRTFARHQRSHSVRLGAEHAAADLLTAVATLTVLLGAAGLAASGQLDLADLPLAVVLAAASTSPILEVTPTAGQLGQIRASATRIFTLLDHPPQVTDHASEPPAGIPPARLTFENVTFRYHVEGPDVLTGVSFTVEPGETAALVGPSGAGKTTCTNLLLRFWDPTSGRITLGGHDLRAYPQDALRSRIAYVPQDGHLFTATIAENLRIGRPDATQADLIDAARQARAHDFITALPNGYQTRLGEHGATLSGGQRQRIAIARALLTGADILVMDEAVANLDTDNEHLIAEALRAARRGRTCMIIAHRPSTIRTADRIIVLANGRIAETGTHSELVHCGGAYATLINPESPSGDPSDRPAARQAGRLPG